jgi:rare lipoprotein A
VILRSSLARVSCIIMVVLMTACASAPPAQNRSSSPASSSASNSRYAMANDSGALEPIDLSKVQPVVPRVERRTVAGNKNPYTVNGVTYHVLPSEEGYTETGMASWYGRKFHGHLTSNGEIYDMFQLSAAHTRLPIPSYVRVTNLDNGKSIIARVNDRGPFHPGRIVDLSYAGAVMLGYADKGTARVRVEAIVPIDGNPNPSQPIVHAVSSVEGVATERRLIEQNTGREFLQVGAFANANSARSLVSRLAALTSLPVFIASDQADNGTTLHKVRIGPLPDGDNVQGLIEAVVRAQLGTPFKIRI